MLLTEFAAHLTSSVIVGLVEGKLVPWMFATFAATAGIGGLLLLRRWWKLRALLFLHILGLEILFLELRLGWTPGTVLLAFVLVSSSGLLFGKRGMIGSVVALHALFVTGWLWVKFGGDVPYFPEDLGAPKLWLRAGLIFVSHALFLAALFRQILVQLARTRAEIASSVVDLRAEALDLETLERQRLEEESRLFASQRLFSLARWSRDTLAALSRIIVEIRDYTVALPQPGADRSQIGKTIRRRVEKAASITRAMLILGRRVDSERSVSSLGILVEKAIGQLDAVVPRTFSLRCSSDPRPEVLVEFGELRLLLSLLLENAVASCGIAGSIDVGVRKAVDAHGVEWAELFLLEQSPSLSVRSHWEAIQRGDSGEAGLSFTLIQGIVRRWGGRVTIERRLLGDRVSIRIPAVAGPDSSRPGESVVRGEERTFLAEDGGRELSGFFETAPSDAWKEVVFRKLEGLMVLLVAVSLFASVVSRGWFFTTTEWMMVGLLSLQIGMTFNRGAGLRARVLVSAFLLGGTSATVIGIQGVMTPSAILVHALVVFLCATYLGVWEVFAMTALLSAPFALGALGFIHIADAQRSFVDARLPGVWVRQAIIFPSLAMAVARLANGLFDVAGRSIEDLSKVRANLVATAKRREEEEQRISDAATVSERLASSEATGRVVGAIAHDLNNALTAIDGFAELLIDAQPEEVEDIDEFVTGIATSTALAEGLLVPFVESTPEGAGAETNLSEAIRRLEPVLRARLGERYRLAFELNDGAVAPISENGARRIVMNLVVNASDAMAQGGTVKVRTSFDGEATVLEVIDQGSGIPERVRAHIFEPFFTTKTEGRGTGLGLHTVRELTDTSGGTLDFQTALGQGTCFTIRWANKPNSSEFPERRQSA